MRIRENRRGMTAVEMLISMSIVGLMSIGLMGMLRHCLTGWGNGAASEAANGYATLALQKLSFDIREGRSSTMVNGKLVITFPLVQTDPTTGEKVYDPVLNDPVTRSYYVVNGTLVCQTGTMVKTLARGVSSMSVPSVANGYVDVVMSSEQQMGTNKKTEQATGHITLRNSNI